ncbi:hypothetical protein MHU86_10182 [Fragilaria crotonensis]|nr:hypothetical protein MHU86_10182 [Fragilaria crotonensis]
MPLADFSFSQIEDTILCEHSAIGQARTAQISSNTTCLVIPSLRQQTSCHKSAFSASPACQQLLCNLPPLRRSPRHDNSRRNHERSQADIRKDVRRKSAKGTKTTTKQQGRENVTTTPPAASTSEEIDDDDEEDDDSSSKLSGGDGNKDHGESSSARSS